MNIHFSQLTLAAVLLTSGISNAYGETFTCSSDRGRSPYPPGNSGSLNHTKYAPRLDELTKQFTAFTSQFDTIDDDSGDGQSDLMGIPEWVAYQLNGVTPGDDGVYREPNLSIERPSNWYEDDKLSFMWTGRTGITHRGMDDSYDGVGTIWNRGHFAMSDHAQRIDGPAACNTHHFWNAAPQAANFNQGNWKHLEDYSAAAANKYGKLWVITGPIVDQQKRYGSIGDSGEVPIAVPHAFFKILIHENSEGDPDVLAFIFEQSVANSAGQPRVVGDWVNCNKAKGRGYVYDPVPYLVSVQDIESRTGLSFFYGLSKAKRDALASSAAVEVWPIEQEYWDPKSTCAGQRFVPPQPR